MSDSFFRAAGEQEEGRWLALAKEAAALLPTSPENVAGIAGILSAVNAHLSALSDQRQDDCRRIALQLAAFGATKFEPSLRGPAELRWVGPNGESAPPTEHPTAFIDRRTVVGWSLYRLTVTTPADEPIFSAQARLTVPADGLASFTNLGKPAAHLIANATGDSAGVQILQRARSAGIDVHPVAQSIIRETTRPLTVVVMLDANGFDDVILYTALFNFSRAFCAFHSGPWRGLRAGIQELRSPEITRGGLAPSESHKVERAAVTAMGCAWDMSYRVPRESQRSTLLGVIAKALEATGNL